MPKKSRFREPFDKQYGKRTQALFKSAWHNYYHILRSLPSQLSSKKSLWLTCQILGLLLKTLAPEEKYLVLHRNKLTIAIQMQLSQKQATFSQFFVNFWNLSEILNVLKKKMTFIGFVFPKLRARKTWLDKCLKSHVLEDNSTSNIVNVLKHCWNLHHITFFIFTDHCQVNWVEKSLSYWHEKSWDCFLRH